LVLSKALTIAGRSGDSVGKVKGESQMENIGRKGMKVNVYLDPMTQQTLEGIARLVYPVGDRDEELGERWIVIFDGYPAEQVHRTVLAPPQSHSTLRSGNLCLLVLLLPVTT
jgi:hypothetical protein